MNGDVKTMRRAGILFVVAAACATLPQSAAGAAVQSHDPVPNTLTAEERAAGFRLLFDGMTLTGWQGFRSDTARGWDAVDGALTRVGPGLDIVTADLFANFELRLEWKISPGGNSGIFFRVSDEANRTWESGPEMQVLDDGGHADGRSRFTSAGSNYGVHASPEGAVRPVGEWNEVTIIANGAHVEYWLNGVKVVEYELWSDEWERLVASTKFVEFPEYGRTRSGRIAFQNYGYPVAYRSIRIRELP